jgi:molybdopterin molybdotransferase
VKPALSVETALATLLAGANPLPPHLVSVRNACGHFLSHPAVGQLPVPRFDNSAMDGYAVQAADAGKAGARLQVSGRSVAGEGFPGALAPGHAIRIFTGAPLPPGSDAVIMQEDTALEAEAASGFGSIQILDPVKPWENVRFRGEDVAPGDLLIPAGAELGPHHLAVLLSTGIDEVSVHPPPRVALVANGSELRRSGESLAPDQIPESNSAMLSALFLRHGARVVSTECVPDDSEQLQKALKSAASQADIVVTVGGASVGDHDLIRPALVSLGGSLDFWRVDMKPGKPFLHGRIGSTPLFGLPGNPVSAFVTAVILVLPILRRLRGDPSPTTRTRAAIWAEGVSNPDSRRHFVRVCTDAEGRIRPSGPQGSHRMASLAAADGLVDLPPGIRIEAGAPARVVCW